MENFQFEEQSSGVNRSVKKGESTMVKLVVKIGLVKDTKGANALFIIVAVISILLAVFIYVFYVMNYRFYTKRPTTNNAAQNSAFQQNFLELKAKYMSQ